MPTATQQVGSKAGIPTQPRGSTVLTFLVRCLTRAYVCTLSTHTRQLTAFFNPYTNQGMREVLRQPRSLISYPSPTVTSFAHPFPEQKGADTSSPPKTCSSLPHWESSLHVCVGVGGMCILNAKHSKVHIIFQLLYPTEMVNFLCQLGWPQSPDI